MIPADTWGRWLVCSDPTQTRSTPAVSVRGTLREAKEAARALSARSGGLIMLVFDRPVYEYDPGGVLT